MLSVAEVRVHTERSHEMQFILLIQVLFSPTLSQLCARSWEETAYKHSPMVEYVSEHEPF